MILLLWGLQSRELAALLWGGSFLFLSSYALVAVLLDQLRLKQDPESRAPAVRIPGILWAGGDFSLDLAWTHRSWPLPGLRRYLEWTLQSPGQKDLVLRAPLKPGHGEYSWHLRLPRGQYKAGPPRYSSQDILGFFSQSFSRDATVTFLVRPPVPLDSPKRGPGGSLVGDQGHRSQLRRPSEDLVEQRKYQPGDDPRRINWKSLAQSGELYLRIGEDNPAPRGRVVAVFDSSAPGQLVPEDWLQAFLDLRIARIQALWNFWVLQGRDVEVHLPELGYRGLWTEGDKGPIQEKLAQLKGTGDGSPALSAHQNPWGTGVRVFTVPQSPWLARIPELDRRHSRLYFFTMEDYPWIQEVTRLWWQQDSQERPGPWELRCQRDFWEKARPPLPRAWQNWLASYHSALEQEVESLRAQGGKVGESDV